MSGLFSKSRLQRMTMALGSIGLSMGALLFAGGSTVAQTTSPREQDVRFSCEFSNGDYMVMYSPRSQPGQRYAWAKPSTMGGGWSAQRRCAEISRRLEFYRPDGLEEMRTSTENGYNVVCVTTEENPACRIVLTVPPGQDPVLTRDRVFENLTIADNGDRTTAVNTFRGNETDLIRQIGESLNLPGLSRRRSSAAINLRPFLDPADGGTGGRLRNNSNRPFRLNPGSFR